MTGHQYEQCRRPRLLKRRYENRAWICNCGRAWVARWYGVADGGFWGWEEWKPWKTAESG